MSPVREKKKERTRRRIVEAAWRLFSEKGFRETSVADIAEAADIGTGTLYNYFPSKEHVLAERLLESGERIMNDYQAKARPDDPYEAICDLLAFMFTHYPSEPELLREAMSVLFQPRADFKSADGVGMDNAFEKLDWQYIALITQILKDGQASGMLSPRVNAESAAFNIYSISMMLWMMYMMRALPDTEQLILMAREQIAVLFDGLKGGTS